jgi:hypothetical protein
MTKVYLNGVQKLYKPVLALFVLLTLCHCGQAPETTPTYTSGTFSSVYNVTLKTACIQCHVSPGINGVKLDFSTQALAYQTLLASKVTGNTTSGICPNVSIVVAGNVSKSYLAAVLIAKYNTPNFSSVSGCSPYSVHLQDQNLSAAEQTSLTDWISGGALDN